MPVSQHWAPRPSRLSSSSARRRSSRCAATSSSSSTGRSPKRRRRRARLGQDDADQQRLLAAGGAARGRLAGAVVGDREVAAVRAHGGPAGLGVGGAGGGEQRGEALLGLERRHARQPALDLALHGEPRAREHVGHLVQRHLQVAHQLVASGRDRHAGLGDLALQRPEPGRVVAAEAQQVRALAQEALVSRGAGGVARVDREHEPVEEAPPARGPLEEEAVHRRCQPDQAQHVGELVLAAQGRAAALDHPPLAVLGGRAREVGEAQGAVDARLQPPGARPLAVSSDRAGAPQAAAGCQQRDRLEQVGLAGAVLADQHDGSGPEVELEPRVVAEVLEGQPPDGRRLAVADTAGLRASQGCRDHTRIGIST